MALIGQGVNPVPIDYSMIGNDAWRVAQSNVSAIGGVIDAVKDRRDKKDAIKTSKKLAEAMSVLYPEAAGALGPVIAELDNEEAPLSQRAALGAQIGEFINMGVQKSRDNALMNLETQRLGLEGRRVAIAEAMPEREAEVARAEASQESTSAMDEAISRYIAIQEEELEFGDKIPKMEESNNLISKFIESGDGKAALSAVDAYEKARRAQIAPLRGPESGLRLTEIPDMDATGQPINRSVFVDRQGRIFDVNGNPLNTSPPFGQKPPEGGSVLPPKDVETKAGDFLPPINEGGRRIQPMPRAGLGIRPAGTPVSPAQLRKDELEIQKMEAEAAAAEKKVVADAAAASANINKLKTVADKYTTVDPATGTRKPNEKLRDVTGPFATVGKFIDKYADPEEFAAKAELQRFVEADLLEATKDLKPVSEDEMKLLMSRRPQIDSPATAWAQYMDEVLGFIASKSPAAGAPAGAAENPTIKATSTLRSLKPPAR